MIIVVRTLDGPKPDVELVMWMAIALPCVAFVCRK